MSLILDARAGLIKNKPASTENSAIRVLTVTEQSTKINRRAIELANRLNELAKARPFNILHRVKKYDPL